MTRSVLTVDQENVSATLAIAVPAARVFAVLADPATHAAIDGTVLAARRGQPSHSASSIRAW